MMKLKSILKYSWRLPFLLFLLTNTHCAQKPAPSSVAIENAQTRANAEFPGTKRLFDGETLNNWEITNFGPQGEVYTEDGEIILGMGDGCTGITWTEDFPKVNYEVRLEAKRIMGIDFFCGMTFPVQEDFCSFIVGGWGGSLVGLTAIDGRDASENETMTLMKFNTNEWYKIKVRVTSEKIETWINDEKIVSVKYEGRQISIRPEVDLSRPFGIATWQTKGAIRNIYLRKL